MALSPYYDCVVIGGGASGFFTAIRLKEEAPHLSVCILEAQQSTLGKVKISGGGRCNVTHILPETVEDATIPKTLMGFYPRQYPQLLGHFMAWSPQQMCHWLEKNGVPTKVEKDGRAFPASDDSASIVQLFESACEAWGIPIRTGSRVTDVVNRSSAETDAHLPQFQHEKAQFILRLSTNVLVEAKTIVLATGGSENGYRLAEQLGLTLTPKVPSLFTFKVDDTALTDLAGVSLPWVKAKLQFPKTTLEAFPISTQGTQPCLDAIADNQEHIGREQVGDVLLVGLELVERCPDVCLLIGRVLQLDHRQRQTIDVDHHIRAAVVLGALDRQLVHHQPVVGSRGIESDDLEADADLLVPI